MTAPARRPRSPSPRLSYRECLTPVRAFYLDLAQWAVEDPARWGAWVAPCPVGAEEINQRKAARHRKSRMDARTRERLPVLPVLVRAVDQRRKTRGRAAARRPPGTPGEAFTAAGQTLTRSVTRARGQRGRSGRTTRPPAKRRDLTLEEDHAFWAWATVEVLRATGIRIEELLEISHHSLVQYRLPDHRRAHPATADRPVEDRHRAARWSSARSWPTCCRVIIRRSRGHGRRGPARPRLRRARTHVARRQRRCCSSAASAPRTAAISDGADPQHAQRRAGRHRPGRPADGSPLHYTPHDFRRIFITDAIMSGLPPHIAQIIAGHQDINVTLGYKAVYPEEAIQAHLAFLARRRALRPSEEYRVPTDAGMGRVPRPLRTPQGRHRHLRAGVRHPVHPRAQLPPVQHALARPRPAAPHRRDPRQPHRPHRRSRARRLARRNRRTQDQPRRRRGQARPDRPALPAPAAVTLGMPGFPAAAPRKELS